MHPFVLLCILLVVGSSNKDGLEGVSSPEVRPFQQGEYLRYNIHYGVLNAGEATFSVLDTQLFIKNRPHYAVRVTGRSYRSWDLFYKVRDFYYSYIDSATMTPSVYSRNIYEGGYTESESFLFKPKEQLAKGKVNGVDTTVKIPFNVQDLASMLYYARSFRFYKMSVGSSVQMNIFFGANWYASRATLVGRETIKTSLGTFRCMKIVPDLVEGRVFKGQNDMVVYVSDDENQVPIRVESEIFVGSIKVDLVEHQRLRYPLSSKIE